MLPAIPPSPRCQPIQPQAHPPAEFQEIHAQSASQQGLGRRQAETAHCPVLTPEEIAALFPVASDSLTQAQATNEPTSTEQHTAFPPADNVLESLIVPTIATGNGKVLASDQAADVERAAGGPYATEESNVSDGAGSSVASVDLLEVLAAVSVPVSRAPCRSVSAKEAQPKRLAAGGKIAKSAKIRRYSQATPSRFCHVCARSSDIVELMPCKNVKFGVCRKAVCEKCFSEQGWDWASAVSDPESFSCCHCTKTCPKNAQCSTYRRTNERRRLTCQTKRLLIEDALATGGDIGAILSRNGF